MLPALGIFGLLRRRGLLPSPYVSPLSKSMKSISASSTSFFVRAWRVGVTWNHRPLSQLEGANSPVVLRRRYLHHTAASSYTESLYLRASARDGNVQTSARTDHTQIAIETSSRAHTCTHTAPGAPRQGRRELHLRVARRTHACRNARVHGPRAALPARLMQLHNPAIGAPPYTTHPRAPSTGACVATSRDRARALRLTRRLIRR